MERVATSPSHYYRVPLPTDLGGAYADISAELLSLRPVQRTWISLEVPEHLTLDPSAFSPSPDEIYDRTAIWDIRRMMEPSLEISFAVEALSEGAGAPSATVRIDFESGARHVAVPVGPPIVVGAAGPTAALTSPPTSTTTPDPPIETPAGEGAKIFLPMVAREKCRTSQPVSIAFVLDTSVSMGMPGPDGEVKWTAVWNGAKAVTEGLDPSRDRIGFVGFDDGAQVHNALTGEFEQVLESIGRQLLMRSGTDIDAGILAGHNMLIEDADTAGPASSILIIVVVTDGRPLPAASNAAIEAAEHARADGIHISVIGIGPDIDDRALRSITGTAGAFLHPTGRVQIEDSFRAVQRWMDCGPPGAS